MRLSSLARVHTVWLVLVLVSCDKEEADWKAAGQRNTADAYQAFIARYPKGKHAPDARQAMLALKRTGLPVERALIGQWRHGLAEQLFDGNNRTLTDTGAKVPIRGTSPYEITEKRPAERAITFKAKEPAPMKGLVPGLVANFDVDTQYRCVFNDTNMQMVCNQLLGTGVSSRPAVETWRFDYGE